MKKKTDDRNYKKRFEKGFKMLCSSKSTYQVWSDCMALFAITLANQSILPMTKDKRFKEIWDKREKKIFKNHQQLFKERTKTFSANVCINCRRVRRKTEPRFVR